MALINYYIPSRRLTQRPRLRSLADRIYLPVSTGSTHVLPVLDSSISARRLRRAGLALAHYKLIDVDDGELFLCLLSQPERTTSMSQGLPKFLKVSGIFLLESSILDGRT